ncbi:disintegrin and metalloproteinase domain-containing protein 17, partial [Elysia marginata]
MCGNGRMDPGEQCDGGGMGLSGLDECCTPDCKLVENAVCSPVNHECCEKCQIAPVNTPCRGASKEL